MMTLNVLRKKRLESVDNVSKQSCTAMLTSVN